MEVGIVCMSGRESDFALKGDRVVRLVSRLLQIGLNPKPAGWDRVSVLYVINSHLVLAFPFWTCIGVLPNGSAVFGFQHNVTGLAAPIPAEQRDKLPQIFDLSTGPRDFLAGN